jgi:hypothetical protein
VLEAELEADACLGAATPNWAPAQEAGPGGATPDPRSWTRSSVRQHNVRRAPAPRPRERMLRPRAGLPRRRPSAPPRRRSSRSAARAGVRAGPARSDSDSSDPEHGVARLWALPLRGAG